MASVTLGQPIDMNGVYSYTLTYHNYRQTGSGSGWSYHGPVVFYTPGGVVDVGAILTIEIFPIPFQLLEFPSPITHISVGGAYTVGAPAIPSQPVYGAGWLGTQWIGERVTVDFPFLLRGSDSITGSSGADKLLGFGGWDSISGLSGNDLILGGAGNDFINGGTGDDIINGGVGIDTLAGGAGDDLLILNTAADVVTENPGEGSDTVRLTYNVTVPTLIDLSSMYGGNVEHAQVIGSGRFNLTGNEAANRLIGNGSNNILIGGAGDDWLDGRQGGDTLIGGLGDDTYIIDNPRDRFTEEADEGTDTMQINRSVDLNSAPFVEIENVVLTGAAALNATGDSGNNTLTGNAGANILSGGAGNDTLNGSVEIGRASCRERG